MTVEIISWSISTKVWDRTGIELATPGSAVRHASVARHVTDCATRPGLFEIRAYIKGRINLIISGSQTYNELCQIHGTSAMSKTLVSRRQRKFQDDFTNSLKCGSCPGQPKTVVTNANSVAVTGLIKRNARLTVKNIAHSVGISLGSAHKILTQQLKL